MGSVRQAGDRNIMGMLDRHICREFKNELQCLTSCAFDDRDEESIRCCFRNRKSKKDHPSPHRQVPSSPRYWYGYEISPG